MRKFFTIFALAIFALQMSVGTTVSASECEVDVVTNTDVVRKSHGSTPSVGDHWVFYSRDTGSGTFETGPGTPPLGVGSFELKTITGNDKAYLFNYDHVGTKLADINKISYSTNREAGSLQQVASLNIEIDKNGGTLEPGDYTTLVFEPVYNTNQGTVTSGNWQSWDAYSDGNAVWWSSNAIPGLPNRDTFVSWNTILQNNPNATIIGGFGANQGSGNAGLTTNIDDLSIGSEVNGDVNCIRYNFDPYKVVTAAAQCKNGGYNAVKRADGSSFKNQGDCMQYVNTGQ